MQYYFWYNSDVSCLPHLYRHGSRAKPRVFERASCTLFVMACIHRRCLGPWICNGGHPLLCLHHETRLLSSTKLNFLELLFGILKVVYPCRRLRTVQLGDTGGFTYLCLALSSKSGLKHCQQREKRHFPSSVEGQRRYEELFLSKAFFAMKASGRSGA